MEEKKNVNEEIENEAVEVTTLDDNDLEEVAGGPGGTTLDPKGDD